MVNIPNEYILSMVMKQRYERSPNGETHINYCILDPLTELDILFPVPTSSDDIESSELHKKLYINDLCLISKINYYDVYSEGTIFVKTSSYNNPSELHQAQILAQEDLLRDNLFYNYLNITDHLELQEVSYFFNLTYAEFYSKFVSNGVSLIELHLEQDLLKKKPNYKYKLYNYTTKQSY